MDCPKCFSAMEKVCFDSLEVNRCTNCRGFFVGEFEKEQAQLLKRAAELDTGDPKAGQELNRRDRLQCPRCDTDMIRIGDPKEPHIRFERCPVCGGSFFDAGELRCLSKQPTR